MREPVEAIGGTEGNGKVEGKEDNEKIVVVKRVRHSVQDGWLIGKRLLCA